MNTELQQALERVAHRVRKVRLGASLALCWALWAAVGLSLIAAALRSDTWGLRSVYCKVAIGMHTATAPDAPPCLSSCQTDGDGIRSGVSNRNVWRKEAQCDEYGSSGSYRISRRSLQ